MSYAVLEGIGKETVFAHCKALGTVYNSVTAKMATARLAEGAPLERIARFN